MHRFISILKISVSLALLTVSILLLGDILGLFPDVNRFRLENRQNISELLAVQVSLAISKHDFALARSDIESVLERQKELLSIGLRSRDGRLISSAGDHVRQWQANAQEPSTLTHVQVPIFSNGQRWGGLELRFADLRGDGPILLRSHPVITLAGFVFALGLLAYFFYMKRTLRQLDPSAVIPERVRAALNTFAEGILILDENEQIVLANTSFGEKIGRDALSIIGYKASELRWHKENVLQQDPELPWTSIIRQRIVVKGAHVELMSFSGQMRSLMVNGSPILDGRGAVRGVIITFDDVTELETKNTQLEKTVTELEDVRQKIIAQNAELQILATRDPLTGCYNRRAFFELYERALGAAQNQRSELSCIMADIDKFKSINDTHGHAIGDKVIKIVAEVLQTNCRAEDLVGRYGGEEFCMVMPGMHAEQAVQAAERIRETVENSGYRFTSGLQITISLGVSYVGLGASSPLELTNQADKALYRAKQTGRNRVVCWTRELEAQSQETGNAKDRRLSDKNGTKDQPVTEPPVESNDASTGELNHLRTKIQELEKAAAERSRELFLQSHYDNLTGLPNLLLFVDRIAHAIGYARRKNKMLAVLVINLSNCRTISDTFGYRASEKLVKDIAERLYQNIRTSDSMTHIRDLDVNSNFSRMGTDEFGILLTDIDQIENITWVVKRIFELLGSPFNVEGHDIFVNSNIGISIFPNDGDDADLLLKDASAARDYSKKLGPNSYKFYRKEINEISLRQVQYETWLRHALEYDEFVLHFQPKVDARTLKIVGFEALIRWNQPDYGWISPNEFIPVAEHCGLINPIGDWVLRAACAQLKEWHELGVQKTALAVNLSTYQLKQGNLVEKIVNALNEFGLEPQYLELEITENVFAESSERVFRNIRQLYEMGYKIHIDDFGTGYSSLAYLKRFPCDTLKIDRAFIRDMVSHPQDKKIVSAIISMAKSMNMHVVAEGVETVEQQALLAELDCNLLQGYLFSKPLPALEATSLLTSNPKFSSVQAKRWRNWFG